MKGRLRLWKVLYVVVASAFVLVGLEGMLRLTFPDPDDYTYYRFFFVSAKAYRNLGDVEGGFWTYQPNRKIREVGVYALPTPLARRPNIFVEYDCVMKSNNLGLLQDNDIKPGEPATVILGDSFTAGQGGCPWFVRLQSRRPHENLVNGGLMGTGLPNWARLAEYLRDQKIDVKKLLLVAISQDFKRPQWVWPDKQLDCLNQGACARDYGWSPVAIDETHSELIHRTGRRSSIRFRDLTWAGLLDAYLHQKAYVYKFAALSLRNVRDMTESAARAEHDDMSQDIYEATTAALDSLKSFGIPIHVLLVSQRNEVGLWGARRNLNAAVEMLKASGIGYSQCWLAERDFMPHDPHPNRAGYDKLVSCVDGALGRDEPATPAR